ncbi:Pleckstrin homology domain-containing protein [Dipodascopsis uninucleata]
MASRYFPTIQEEGADHRSLPDTVVTTDDYPFTAFRLSHGSAQHLNLTTRSVFMGPFPSDWLRRHQKEWLARVSRSNDEAFRSAWSSAFPDSSAVPPPAPVSSSKGASRPISISGKSKASTSMERHTADMASRPPIGGVRTPILETPKRKQLSRSGSSHIQITLNSPKESIAGPSNITGQASSRVSSSYDDAKSHFTEIGSQNNTPVGTPPQSKFMEHKAGGINNSITTAPFTRYDEDTVIYSDKIRGRSTASLNINGASSERGRGRDSRSPFAPSSFTSNQTFITADELSRVASSRGRDSSSSCESSLRQRSHSQDSGLTIRPSRSAAAIPGPVAVSTESLASHIGYETERIVPHFHSDAPEMAVETLNLILQRDRQSRSRLRSDRSTSRGSRSQSREPLLPSGSELDRDHLALNGNQGGNGGEASEDTASSSDDDDDDDHSSHSSNDSHDGRSMEFQFGNQNHRVRDLHDVEDVNRLESRQKLNQTSFIGLLCSNIFHDSTVSNKQQFMAHLKPGQVVKVDRVLMSLKSTKALSLPSEFNESDHVHLNVVERAREYIAVARYTQHVDVPFVFQLYKTQTVPYATTEFPASSLAYTIPLTKNSVFVNLFSSLDKSIVLWSSDVEKSVTKLYIMRFHSPSISVAWYGFLRSVLGGKVVRDIIVQVPDLDMSLKIMIPWGKIQKYVTRRLDNPTLSDLPAHDELPPTAISEFIVKTAFDLLRRVPDFRNIVKRWQESDDHMSLAWRRYDRIEWAPEMTAEHMYAAWSLRRTHELELRPKVHYPTSAIIPTDRSKSIAEPPPIEGFLIRLTQYSGTQKQFGRLFFKQFYFMTHDNLLLFCRPHHASPPPFEKPFSMTDRSGTKMFVHEFTPYPLTPDGKEISWLDSSSKLDSNAVRKLDDIALSEMYRRLYQILRSNGFVDLCDVDEIRPVKRKNDTDENIGVGNGPDFNQPARNESLNSEDGTINEFDDERVFELVLKSGLIIRLQSFNKLTRDEWISRLTALRDYWRLRTEGDSRAMIAVKADNLSQLHIDEEMESQIGESASKWEALRGVADPQIYNVCTLGFCRSITIKGPLFFKVRKQATFRQSYIVVCHGHLIIYENQVRARTGVEVPKIYRKKREIISLRDCYVYSGIITEQDLLTQNVSFANGPGMYSLPRIYRDGTTASDDEFSRCFVIWRARKTEHIPSYSGKAFAKWYRSKHKKTIAPDCDLFYSIDKLGVSGTGLLFMARSRMEKERWVSVLTQEIGRTRESSISLHDLNEYV